MLVKIEARILIFPGTDFHFPSTSVPSGTFFRAFATPLCVYPPPFLAIHHCCYGYCTFPAAEQQCSTHRSVPDLSNRVSTTTWKSPGIQLMLLENIIINNLIFSRRAIFSTMYIRKSSAKQDHYDFIGQHPCPVDVS